MHKKYQHLDTFKWVDNYSGNCMKSINVLVNSTNIDTSYNGSDMYRQVYGQAFKGVVIRFKHIWKV